MKKYIFAHPWLLLFAAVTGGIMQGLMVVDTLLVARLVDALIAGDGALFFRYALAAAVIVALLWLSLRICVRMFAIYAGKSNRTLERDFFASILATKISDFNRNNSGKYISVLNNDMKTISQSYFSTVANLSKDGLMVLMGVTAMVFISPLNAVIAVAMTGLPLLAPMVYGKRLARVTLEKSTVAMGYNQKIKDYLSGFEVIKSFGIEKTVKTKFDNETTRLMRADVKAGGAAADVGALSISIMRGASFINYFVAGFFALRGNISVGEVVAIVSLGMTILAPMTQLANHISSFKSAKEVARRVLDMMQQKDNTPRPLQITALENDITFTNVSFSHKPENAEKRPAVSNFSYTFKRGGKYAIIGASGSGKSTLTKLLMGYYDDYSGSIRINNKEIREVDRTGLYRVFTMLHQNVFLLDDTLRNNITLYNAHNPAAYQQTLQRANLTDLEATLAQGSDTLLGEGGNTLSGGERQRIAIARALLKGSEVLVLDEATTGLDNAVADEIEKSIITMPDLTCIFVTHRYNPEMLALCDGVLVMKNGELCEQGTYAE